MKEKVPDNYFKEFPDKLLQKMESMKDDLQTLSPNLSKMDKTEPYRIPDGYLASQRNKVYAALGILKKTSETSGRWWKSRQLFYISGIAASAIIMVMFFTPDSGALMDNSLLASTEDNLIDIELGSIIDWMEVEGMELDAEDLLRLEEENFFDAEGTLVLDNIPDEELDEFFEFVLDEISDEDLSLML